MRRREWSEETSDEELVAAFRAGVGDAFEALVLRHQKGLYNLAYRMLGNAEEAAEVTQDAFVAAYKGLASFRGEARFRTWLTAIALNRARNALESLASRRRHEAYSLDAPLPGREGEPPPEPPAQGPSALDLLERRARRLQVEKCIEALPADFREALVLRDLQEFSYEEIGALLKVREGTVKSRLFRAREGVKNCLEGVAGAP